MVPPLEAFDPRRQYAHDLLVFVGAQHIGLPALKIPHGVFGSNRPLEAVLRLSINGGRPSTNRSMVILQSEDAVNLHSDAGEAAVSTPKLTGCELAATASPACGGGSEKAMRRHDVIQD